MRFSKEDWEATQLMLANEPRVRWTAKAEEAYSVKAQYDVSLSRLAKEEDVEAMGAKEIRDRLVEMVTGVNKAKLREKRAKAKKSLFLPHYRAFMESRATAGTREDTLEGLRINGSAFVGKRVILFDDVTTTGRSFVQLADNLMDAGATQVVGFFLGKTDY